VKYTLTVDPGVKASAWAEWHQDHLVRCGLSAPPLRPYLGDYALVTVEKPRVYPGTAKTDPNDLIDLAVEVGRLLGAYEKTRCVYPFAWKRNATKPAAHAVIWRALSLGEQDAATQALRDAGVAHDVQARIAKGLAGGAYRWVGHNLLDAIGIGLDAHKRVCL
jgi:hypothetical protein